MADIQFSPEAMNNLVETKRYITDELGSEDAAKNTIDKIIKCIKGLEIFPRNRCAAQFYIIL